MAVTKIAWTGTPMDDGSMLPGYTFNPWWGCSKVGPGCDHCYAEVFDAKQGGDHWGVDKTPRVMSGDNWRNPNKWLREAKESGIRRNVFCGSMCDWTDKNAPDGQREKLWDKIRETADGLNWLLLTKRAPNIHKYLPPDWGEGYENVWMGVTVENRSHGLPRIDALRKIPAKVRFLSIEPLLEDLGEIDLTGIHWVIVGGESGDNARPMEMKWVLNIKRQCDALGIPFFYKQKGGRKDKGDCLIDGVEYKAWPLVA